MTIDADIIHINKQPFLTTVSHEIEFVTTEHLQDLSKKKIGEVLKSFCKLYGKYKFNVIQINAEIELKSAQINDSVGDAIMNYFSKKEHVPKIERKNQVIKERVRSLYATLSYLKKLPKLMRIGLVYEVTKWLNIFPVSNSVSDLYSPRTIVTGRKLDWQKDCKI